jgi:hypothetical protein
MRTKRILKRAKAADAGNAIEHALGMGWSASMIQKHGNAAVRKALKAAGGVAQPQVVYGTKTDRTLREIGLAELVTAQPRKLAEERVDKSVHIDFANAERFPITLTRNGAETVAHININPARPRKDKKGLTHDVLYTLYVGSAVYTERKTLSELAVTRLKAGERCDVWLDGHGYLMRLAD